MIGEFELWQVFIIYACGIGLFICGYYLSTYIDDKYPRWLIRIGFCSCALAIIGVGIYDQFFYNPVLW